MFCSECGARAAGKFCSHCGHALLVIAEQTQPLAETIASTLVDWAPSIDYEAIISVPAVRKRIAHHATQSKKRMTGEEILDLYGKALGKLSGAPVALPMTAVAHFAQSLHAKLGIKTGKSRTATFTAPPGEVLVSILCNLAREGRALRDVQQASDGCTLVAALPSDLFSLEGDLVIAVSRHAAGTRVEARTDIQGQMFDWGKSARCLDQLFAELGPAVAA